MTYDGEKKRTKRRIKRDPLTGLPVSKQERDFVWSDAEFYLDNKGYFDPKVFNENYKEKCDLFCTTSMAAITTYSRQYFEDFVLPEIHTYKIGPVRATCTASVEVGAAEFRKRQAAKQSAAGKRNSGNLLRWRKSDVSSGDFND